jgi:hypothetical protein
MLDQWLPSESCEQRIIGLNWQYESRLHQHLQNKMGEEPGKETARSRAALGARKELQQLFRRENPQLGTMELD